MAKRSDETNRTSEIARAFRACRAALVAAIVFSFFINLLMLVAPVYMLQVYDRVLSSQSVETLIMLTLVAVVLLLALAGLDVVRSMILVRVGMRFDRMLTSSVFQSVFRRSLVAGEGGQGQALRDLDSLREFLTGGGLIAFCDAPWVPIFIAVGFVLHPWLGLVSFVGAMLIFGMALTNELGTRNPIRAATGLSLTSNAFVGTSLRNAEAIRAMDMIGGVERRWGRTHRAALGLQAQASGRAGVILSSSKFLRQVLQIVVLGLGAYLVIRGEITAGTMVATSIIMGRALAPVETAVSQWRSFVGARSAFERLKFALEAAPPEPARIRLPDPHGHISVEAAAAVPPGGKTPTLRHVTFTLAPGEALGVVGPSASGKSTLARLLVGVWPPAAGSVRLDGAEIGQWDRSQLGEAIGYVPQDVELFEGTVAENIARFRDEQPDPEQVVAAAMAAGAHEMILRLPESYETQIGAGGEVLSGGQRQRIALARAFYGDPVFIVLDEPNANLDGRGEAALSDALYRAKAGGATLVVVTHRPSLLESVDKILVLREGRMEAFGPRDEILELLLRSKVAAAERADEARLEERAAPTERERLQAVGGS